MMSKTFKIDDNRDLVVTNSCGEGIFFSTEVFMSMTAEELIQFQQWLKEEGEGIFGAFDLVDCGCIYGSNKHDDFRTAKEYIKPRRLMAIENSRYAREYDKEIASAVLSGNRNPYPKPEKVAPEKKIRGGYVYLLKADNGLFKIGKAAKLDNRIHNLGVKLPVRTELVHSISAKDMRDAEAQLHDLFADKRDHGEWFALTEPDVTLIMSMAEL